jgi:hypothetical protein
MAGLDFDSTELGRCASFFVTRRPIDRRSRAVQPIWASSLSLSGLMFISIVWLRSIRCKSGGGLGIFLSFCLSLSDRFLAALSSISSWPVLLKMV